MLKDTHITRKTILVTIASLIVISLLSACNNTMTKSSSSDYTANSTIDTTDPRARLIYGSEALVGKIRMANLKLRKVGMFTQAQFGIQNLSNARYTLEYKVEWEDANGFMVDQFGVWRRVTLSPSQITTILATGKKQEAEKIVVNLRLPDDAFINLNKQLKQDAENKAPVIDN